MQPFSCSCLHRKATVDDVVVFFMPEMKSHSSSPAAPAATGTAGRRQERKASDRNRKEQEKNKKIEKIAVDSSPFFLDSFSRLLFGLPPPTIFLPFLSELVMSVGRLVLSLFFFFFFFYKVGACWSVKGFSFLFPFPFFAFLFLWLGSGTTVCFHHHRHRHLRQKPSISSRQLGINRLFPVDWRQLLLERVECGCNCNDSRAVDDFLKIGVFFLDKSSLLQCWMLGARGIEEGPRWRRSSVVDANQALDPYLPIVH